jgi:hypothetical protein
MRAALILAALALAACTPPAEAPTAPAEEAAVEALPTPFTGDYIAISTTAMSITGDLNATADVLSFAKGFRIEGERVDASLAGDTDLSAGGGTVNSGSGIEAAEDEHRRVDTVRAAADAPDPNLCSGTPVTYIILGRGSETLTLQVFSGADAPGPNAHNTQLCGIYNFAPS